MKNAGDGMEGSRPQSSVPADPAKAYSVGEMLALGWIVRARCKTCWKVWPVNLQAIVKATGAVGPGAVLPPRRLRPGRLPGVDD